MVDKLLHNLRTSLHGWSFAAYKAYSSSAMFSGGGERLRPKPCTPSYYSKAKVCESELSNRNGGPLPRLLLLSR